MHEGSLRPEVGAVKCGPKVKEKDSTMTNSNLKPAGLAIAARPALWSVAIAAQLQKPNRIPAVASLRVPVTPANREYLRAVRQAELAAWEGAGSATSLAALRAEVQQALRRQRGETRVLTGLAAVSFLAVATGAAAALDFVAHWTEFTNLVRHLLG